MAEACRQAGGDDLDVRTQKGLEASNRPSDPFDEECHQGDARFVATLILLLEPISPGALRIGLVEALHLRSGTLCTNATRLIRA